MNIRPIRIPVFLAFNSFTAKELPGSRQALAQSVASGTTSCSCSSLLSQLGKLREKWKHMPLAPVADLDMAVTACGTHSAATLQEKGYDIPTKRLTACRGQRLHRKRQSKRRGPGRPSKVNDPEMILAVRAVLEQNSTASSNTCVVKGSEDGERQRKQVRSLSALPLTIYRSSPSIRRNLAERQFRSILKLHCKEFKRGRRKTDLCDHCITYRQKILPRVREFIQRCDQELEAVCPGYWKPFYAHKILSMNFAFSACFSFSLNEPAYVVHFPSFRCFCRPPHSSLSCRPPVARPEDQCVDNEWGRCGSEAANPAKVHGHHA